MARTCTSRASGLRTRLALATLMAVGMLTGPADANWLSRLSRVGTEAGEAGIVAGRAAGEAAGAAALSDAARALAKLPVPSKGTASLAAHATPEGHWKFVNRDGEVFTAANADELSRMTTTLAPDLAPGGKLRLYLSEDTIFTQRTMLKDLPEAELYVVSGDHKLKLVRETAGGSERWLAEARDHLLIDLTERDLFEEALYQLGRPLNRSNVRMLALEPGGPSSLGSVPRFDPATRAPLVDAIEPASLSAALGKVRGQTVMLSGRLEGDRLFYRGSTGGEQSIAVDGLRSAAADADVNLVLLKSAASRQPGGRNWLWQRVEVAGLDDAMTRATYGDFLSALGSSSSELTLTAARDGYGRMVFNAVPASDPLIPVPGTVTDWIGDAAGETLGRVAVHSVTAFTRDKERQEELDLRIVPGIPSAVQIMYLAAIAMGLIGFEFTVPWWARIWQPERREEYRSAIGYHAARAARLAAYLLLFLPIAGIPAFIAAIAMQMWAALTAPFRFLGWLKRKIAYHSGQGSAT